MILPNQRVDVMDTGSARVTIIYDGTTETHVVRYQCDPDEHGWAYTIDKQIRVGELRHALAIAGLVVDAFTQGVTPPAEYRLEGFDAQWAVFTYPWLNMTHEPVF